MKIKVSDKRLVAFISLMPMIHQVGISQEICLFYIDLGE